MRLPPMVPCSRVAREPTIEHASARAVVGSGGSRSRKLLVALWRYVTEGVVPQGALFKA